MTIESLSEAASPSGKAGLWVSGARKKRRLRIYFTNENVDTYRIEKNTPVQCPKGVSIFMPAYEYRPPDSKCEALSYHHMKLNEVVLN